VLSAGRGLARWDVVRVLVRALPDVAWTECGASCVWLVGPRICGRVGGTRDIPVEALFPQGRKHVELSSSGWSGVLGIDAVGGPPYCNVAERARCSGAFPVQPILGDRQSGRHDLGSGRRGRRPAGIALSGRAPSPDGYGAFLECPGARAADLGSRRELREAPVEDRRPCRLQVLEVASAGGCQQVAERVLLGFGREGEQVGLAGSARRVHW
jgi:hypothetical protein